MSDTTTAQSPAAPPMVVCAECGFGLRPCESTVEIMVEQSEEPVEIVRVNGFECPNERCALYGNLVSA